MFKFLKEKIKAAVGTFQEKVAEEVPETESTEAIELTKEAKQELQTPVQTAEEVKEEKKEEEKGFFTKLKEKITEKKEEPVELPPAPEAPLDVPSAKPAAPDAPVEQAKEEKRGFLEYVKEKVTTKTISKDKFEELFWDIELALLENNVSVEVIEKIKTDLKETLTDKPIKKTDYDDVILLTLKKSIQEILTIENTPLIQRINEKAEKPYIIVFVGVNGVGKTSSISKIAHYLKTHGKTMVLAAGDTWRAGSVEQLETWANRLNVPIIKGQYGADAASIAFDAIAMAKSKNIDVVLIDTAGRQHKNINLMRELQKIITVSKPDLTLLTVESIVGNDAVEQATNFGNSINLDGNILTKADIDEKGGAILSIAYVTKKPIFFLGTGQEPQDLEEFNSEKIMQRLGI